MLKSKLCCWKLQPIKMSDIIISPPLWCGRSCKWGCDTAQTCFPSFIFLWGIRPLCGADRPLPPRVGGVSLVALVGSAEAVVELLEPAWAPTMRPVLQGVSGKRLWIIFEVVHSSPAPPGRASSWGTFPGALWVHRLPAHYQPWCCMLTKGPPSGPPAATVRRSRDKGWR